MVVIVKDEVLLSEFEQNSDCKVLGVFADFFVEVEDPLDRYFSVFFINGLD